MRDEGDDAVAEKRTKNADAAVAIEVPAPEAAPESAPAPEAVKKPIEVWATEKGMLPQFFAPTTPRQSFPGEFDPRAGRTIHRVSLATTRGLVPRTNPNFWKFHAAKAHEQANGRWFENTQVTEAEFDKVIELVTTGQSQR